MFILFFPDYLLMSKVFPKELARPVLEPAPSLPMK